MDGYGNAGSSNVCSLAGFSSPVNIKWAWPLEEMPWAPVLWAGVQEPVNKETWLIKWNAREYVLGGETD